MVRVRFFRNMQQSIMHAFPKVTFPATLRDALRCVS